MFETKDWISLGSLFLAACAFLYSYFSNTKRYELSINYRNQIISWYNSTIELLIRIRLEAQNKNNNTDQYRELLAKLSALIEVGRFYFPNIDRKDGFGKEKQLAYQGYRNIIIDFLVYSYDLFNQKNPEKYIEHSIVLQRYFTSYVFEIINPQKHLKDTRRYTKYTFDKGFCIEDFLNNEPDAMKLFILR